VTNRPTVTVVVPVRNGAATIGDTLAGLAGQAAWPPGYELLVVDNGSTDATREIVRARGVTCVDEPTPGVSAVRNRGLRLARGEVLAFLDADTVPSRRWLAALASPFADPEVVIAAGRTLAYPLRTSAERYVAASGLFDSERAVSRTPFPFAPGLNMAVRREAALAVGGWAEDLLAGEDVDFSFRLLRNWDATIVYRPDAVLFHRHRSTDESLRRQAWSYGDGAARLYRRYPDVINWGPAQKARVAGRLAARTAAPAALTVGRAVRRVSPERVEFAAYHRLWTWAFWRGFASAYKEEGRRRP
jgi:cellulose synthase/poly-beta-1,6-N-acetylglucosamine synthase-like glycosyltransferase